MGVPTIRKLQEGDLPAVWNVFSSGMLDLVDPLVEECLAAKPSLRIASKLAPVAAAITAVRSKANLFWSLLSFGVSLKVVDWPIRMWFKQTQSMYVKASLKGDLSNISDVYGTPGSAFWVAEVDGQVVGCVALERLSDTQAELRRLSVSKASRGQGIAKALVQELINHARAQGFQSVILTTSSAQKPAIALYTKMGWVTQRVFTVPTYFGYTFRELLLDLTDTSVSAAAETAKAAVTEPAAVVAA